MKLIKKIIEWEELTWSILFYDGYYFRNTNFYTGYIRLALKIPYIFLGKIKAVTNEERQYLEISILLLWFLDISFFIGTPCWWKRKVIKFLSKIFPWIKKNVRD